jgi:mRNA-degrading endonuclease YafQ of YafQ-DinJ toxin-antitoxin module
LIRPLLRSTAFITTARKLARKEPRLILEIKEALDLLSEDAFHTRLKTHKLKGRLKGSLACSAGYDLRIIF